MPQLGIMYRRMDEIRAQETLMPKVKEMPHYRTRKTGAPLTTEPPLGFKEAIVVKALKQLGDQAYGLQVIERLMEASDDVVDAADVYSTIRRLKAKLLLDEPKVVKQDGTPPLKVYTVNAAGLAALKATTAHHRAVAAFLD
jgi:Transcriptional regulator PadR-like family